MEIGQMISADPQATATSPLLQAMENVLRQCFLFAKGILAGALEQVPVREVLGHIAGVRDTPL